MRHLSVIFGLLSAIIVLPVQAASWKDVILLYAPTDGTADAQRAAGDGHARLTGPTSFEPGRVGKGLALPRDAACSFPVAGTNLASRRSDLYDQPISSSQIAAVVTGRETVRLTAADLSRSPASATAPNWSPEFAASRLSDSVTAYCAPETIRFGQTNVIAAPAGSYSPYLQGLFDYDFNAFHNW